MLGLGLSLSLGAQYKGGGWNPGRLGDDLLDMWDAQVASSLTLSGAAVSGWASVKNGYDAVQAISASKPIYSATGLNGRPVVTHDGADDRLTYTGVGIFPTGAAACEIWALINQTALPANTATGILASYGGNGSPDRRRVSRIVDTGVNRAQIGVGNGSGETTRSNTSADLSGICVVRGIITGTAEQVDVSGVAGASAAVVPATGTTRFRIGANTAETAGGFFQGGISFLAITTILSTEQAAEMLAYLKARGGIS